MKSKRVEGVVAKETGKNPVHVDGFGFQEAAASRLGHLFPTLAPCSGDRCPTFAQNWPASSLGRGTRQKRFPFFRELQRIRSRIRQGCLFFFFFSSPSHISPAVWRQGAETECLTWPPPPLSSDSSQRVSVCILGNNSDGLAWLMSCSADFSARLLKNGSSIYTDFSL